MGHTFLGVMFLLTRFFFFLCFTVYCNLKVIHVMTVLVPLAVQAFKWTMDFCSILKLTRVDVGNVSKKGKIWEVVLLKVFYGGILLGVCLTKLCLYIRPMMYNLFVPAQKSHTSNKFVHWRVQKRVVTVRFGFTVNEHQDL